MIEHEEVNGRLVAVHLRTTRAVNVATAKLVDKQPVVLVNIAGPIYLEEAREVAAGLMELTVYADHLMHHHWITHESPKAHSSKAAPAAGRGGSPASDLPGPRRAPGPTKADPAQRGGGARRR